MRSVLVAFMLANATVTFSGNTVLSAGCALDGPKLDCTNKEEQISKADIVAAFAAQATRDLLSTPINDLERFQSGNEREAFRKSFEGTWRLAGQEDRIQRRNLRRGKIDAAEYQQWSSTYNAALKTYQVALDYYRALWWHARQPKQ